MYSDSKFPDPKTVYAQYSVGSGKEHHEETQTVARARFYLRCSGLSEDLVLGLLQFLK